MASSDLATRSRSGDGTEGSAEGAGVARASGGEVGRAGRECSIHRTRSTGDGELFPTSHPGGRTSTHVTAPWISTTITAATARLRPSADILSPPHRVGGVCGIQNELPVIRSARDPTGGGVDTVATKRGVSHRDSAFGPCVEGAATARTRRITRHRTGRSRRRRSPLHRLQRQAGDENGHPSVIILERPLPCRPWTRSNASPPFTAS